MGARLQSSVCLRPPRETGQRTDWCLWQLYQDGKGGGQTMPLVPEFHFGMWNGSWFTLAYLAIHAILFFVAP